MVVIETDGNIEQAESLKSPYDQAPTTGLPIRGVYCPDLLRIIDHIRSAVEADIIFLLVRNSMLSARLNTSTSTVSTTVCQR